MGNDGAAVVFALCGMAFLSGCKKPVEVSTPSASGSNASQASFPAKPATSQYDADQSKRTTYVPPGGTPSVSAPAGTGSGIARYSDPPAVDVGLSVEQAYAAIPHRRTVWTESDSTVPEDERAYLRAIFQVIDEAIAVRVASLQNDSAQRFEDLDVDGQFERLISFARSMPVPARLGAYHNHILSALLSDRQFFAEWKSQGAAFRFAQQIAAHAGVQAASAAARAAYGELMSNYPGESISNKEAFFDYHCALDFL
jgi:hypothetical protein